MFKKLLQYKRMIGEAIALSKQNNELSQRSYELLKQNNELALHDYELVRQNYEQTQRDYELVRQNSLLLANIENLIHSFTLESKEMFNRLDLLIKLQNEVVAVNTTAFTEYQNVHAGRDVVIVGSGPTLNKYIPIENAIHIGVNSVCTNKRIALDYYFTQDFGGDDCKIKYGNDIIDLSCKKFFGLLADIHLIGVMEPSQSFCMQANATRYYVDQSPSIYLLPDIRYRPLMDFCSVVFPALHFAFFTNPRRIFLIGCDASYSGYFTQENQLDTVDQKRHYLNIMLVGFRRLKEFAQTWYPDTEIISINPVNLKGLFRDMYTDESGGLYDSADSAGNMDFSDLHIKNFVDEHIEKELLRRMSTESSCEECGQQCFSIVRGLSDDFPNNIYVKCDECGYSFDYPQHRLSL